MAKRRRGFTLIELLISASLGAALVFVAVRVSTDHQRILGRTTARVEMGQAGRMALELLAHDLRPAGVGVGYQPDGTFSGLAFGSFSVPGGAVFTSNDLPITLEDGSIVTDDLGVLSAVGDVRTVADWAPNVAQTCAGGAYAANDVVALFSREGLFARSARVLNVATSPCTSGSCLAGCNYITLADDATFASDNEARVADYEGGEMFGDLRYVVWFVIPGEGRGQLRRAEVTSQSPCQARDAGCGVVVAEGVESLQIAFWQWDPETLNWSQAVDAIRDRRRLRADVELLVRGAPDPMNVTHEAGALELAPGRCMPESCGRGSAPRWVVRGSVELRNSGRLELR